MINFSAKTLRAGATELPFRAVSERKIGLTTSTRASSGKTVVEAGVMTWKAPCFSLLRIWRWYLPSFPKIKRGALPNFS